MTVELIRQAHSGDHAAFEMLATATYERLYGIAYRILRNREAAEDATQDALVRCWRDLRGLREPDRFEAWLHRLEVTPWPALAPRGHRGPEGTYRPAGAAGAGGGGRPPNPTHRLRREGIQLAAAGRAAAG